MLTHKLFRYLFKTWTPTLIVLMLAALYYVKVNHVMVNLSASLPFYAVKTDLSDKMFVYDDLIVFKTKYKAYEGENLIKEVKWLPGDAVSYFEKLDHTYVLLNDVIIGEVHPYDRKGKPLHRGFEGVIPDEHYFVYTPHPKSFDSRYDELGLVHERDVIGKAHVLF